MSGIVIDASFVGLINLPDELPSAEARTLVRALDGRSLHVPSHWHLEVANMLVKAERRSRITREGRASVLSDVGEWPVNIDRKTSDHAWPDILPLADKHGLTVYDAAYLELSLRIGAAFASNDKRLIAAARELGVEVLTVQP